MRTSVNRSLFRSEFTICGQVREDNVATYPQCGHTKCTAIGVSWEQRFLVSFIATDLFPSNRAE